MTTPGSSNGPLFPGLEPPGPPPELRDSVRRRVVEALAAPPEPDLWARLWYSRAARLAWASAVAVLLVCHVALEPRRIPLDRVMAVPMAVFHGESDAELVAMAHLPRVRMGRLLSPEETLVNGLEAEPGPPGDSRKQGSMP